MIDLKLSNGDLQIENGDFVLTDTFDTSLKIALQSVGDSSWSDEFISNGGKFATLKQERASQKTANRATDYAKKDLEYLKDINAVENIEATTTLDENGLTTKITLSRENDKYNYYYNNWELTDV